MVWKALGFSLLFISLLHIFTISSAKELFSSGSVNAEQQSENDSLVIGRKTEGGFHHGGGSTGTGNDGNPGTNFIPVYAAGAANNHRQNNIHHGKGNCNLKAIGYPSLLLLTSLFSLLNSFRVI